MQHGVRFDTEMKTSHPLPESPFHSFILLSPLCIRAFSYSIGGNLYIFPTVFFLHAKPSSYFFFLFVFHELCLSFIFTFPPLSPLALFYHSPSLPLRTSVVQHNLTFLFSFLFIHLSYCFYLPLSPLLARRLGGECERSFPPN